MFKYTLAFLKRGNEVLMLNRNKSPWMGSWNGVGGKIDEHETLIDSIIREIFEETNILVSKDSVIDKGYVTWNSNDLLSQGLHVFLVELDSDFMYQTPVVTTEGILDWKQITWISNFENSGVCDNIPYFIGDVINNHNRYNHKCTFKGNILLSVERELL